MNQKSPILIDAEDFCEVDHLANEMYAAVVAFQARAGVLSSEPISISMMIQAVARAALRRGVDAEDFLNGIEHGVASVIHDNWLPETRSAAALAVADGTMFHLRKMR